MKSFIYKTIIILIAIILLYEFTIGKQIALFKDRFEILLSKEGRRDGVDKIRNEIQKAVNKERYLSKEDAILLNKFIKKIEEELKEAESN
jgi:DnaJ-domain-containing protein 1